METLTWPIERLHDQTLDMPHQLITRRPFDASGALDPITALLLPSAGIAMGTYPAAPANQSADPRLCCAGLWMGSCFPVSVNQRASKLTFGWISNFPATSMYDDDFTESLEEVELGPSRELQQLTSFKTLGQKLLLTVTPTQIIPDKVAQTIDGVLIVLRSHVDIASLRDECLARLQKQLRPGVPIILHGGAQSHLPSAPSQIGIDGILQMPNTM